MFNFLFNQLPSISISELKERLQQPIQLLDVRSPQEYREGHIPLAKNVPLERIESYNGKDKEVYVICQSGMRSKKATEELQNKGYQAVNVRGGMNQWTGKTRGGK